MPINNENELQKLMYNKFARKSRDITEELKSLEPILTNGQKAVGLTFNPSGDPKVLKAKQLCADLIDLLEEDYQSKCVSTITWYSNVFRAEAFNNIISAQMSLVKFLTWQDK